MGCIHLTDGYKAKLCVRACEREPYLFSFHLTRKRYSKPADARISFLLLCVFFVTFPLGRHSRSFTQSLARSHTHFITIPSLVFCVHKWRKSSLPPTAAAVAADVVVVVVVVNGIVIVIMKASEGDTKTSTQASYYNRYFTLRVYALWVWEKGKSKHVVYIYVYFVIPFHSVRHTFVGCVAFNVDFNGISTPVHRHTVTLSGFAARYQTLTYKNISIEPFWGKGSPSHRFHLFMYTVVRIHLNNNNNNNTDKNNNTLFSDKDAGLASK